MSPDPSSRDAKKFEIPCRFPVKQGIEHSDWFAQDYVAHHIEIADFSLAFTAGGTLAGVAPGQVLVGPQACARNLSPHSAASGMPAHSNGAQTK